MGRRVWYASLCVLIAVGLLWLTEGASDKRFWALMAGAFAFFGLAWWLVSTGVYADRMEATARYFEAFALLDPEQRNALAFNIPAFHLRATRGQVAEYFEDTTATAEHIRLFLLDSDDEHTSSQHGWNTAEKPRRAWEEIYDWLVRKKKVWPDSASGSHSYRWRGTAYQSMMLYYLSVSIPDLNAEPARAYVSETKLEREER